ncbi:MAG: hypothetical protein KDA24_09325 [Deltaproteobacteria bacterium]|nr:hypothetical protein [Deltaproteobacteria bacterium]
MREIGEALRLLFGKLSDFLDVFDLSFLISGGVTLLAFLYVGWVVGVDVTTVPADPAIFFVAFAALLVAYVSGLICFSVGRFLRRTLQQASAPWYGRDAGAFVDTRLDPIVRGHGLDQQERYTGYFGSGKASKFLYVRMWADLRHDPRREASLALLNRYWKLAATYDGLAATSVIWLLVFAVTGALDAATTNTVLPPLVSYGFAALAAIGFGACCLEAKRYDRYQLEELAATMAAEPPADLLAQRWDPRMPLPPLGGLLRDGGPRI